MIATVTPTVIARSEATKQSRATAPLFVRLPWIASPQARLAMTIFSAFES
jgi:hypothetical protein